MQPLLYRFAVALFFAACFGYATADTGVTTKDWEQVAARARAQGIPIVMVVTGNGCGHCERMKSEFLYDPTIQSFLGERALVRVYPESTGGKITDFDGERIRARMFIDRYEIFATPTLLFLDPDGKPIADPVVGYNDAVNYRDQVTGRLDEAQLALETDQEKSGSAIVTVDR